MGDSMIQLFPITVALVALTTFISWRGFGDQMLRSNLLMNPYAVRHHGKYYRLVAHGFIHANWMHLIVNMIVLWFFGRNMELFFKAKLGMGLGIGAYLLLYLGGVVVATFPSLWKHKDNPHYNSIGASGGTSAILLASILINPLQTLYLYFSIPMPAWIFAILFFGYEIYMQRRGGTGIAHDAHIFGAIFGLVFMTVVDYRILIDFGTMIKGAVGLG